MYDAEGTDTDREWIELYNSGSESVDLSSYKLFEANSNHGLTLEEGDKNIAPLGYAIIVQDKTKFKTDYPNFSGNIFRASFSLNNEGEALSIKDADLNIVDSYSYLSSTGASGDGKSLQKASGTWGVGAPSPGAVNASTNTNTENTNNTGNTNTNTNNTQTGSGSSSSSSSNTSPVVIKKIETNILAPSFIFVNLPMTFEAKTTGTSGEDLHYGKYYWNFGDGTSLEQDVVYANKFSHIFYYPGDYEIRLEYYGNPYSSVPTALDTFTIKVIPASIIISSVGGANDFFIELTNNTEYNADISHWYLSSYNRTFVFPKNTYLQSKKKMILSNKITNFVFGDDKNLKLINTSGEVVFDYGAYKNPVIVPIIRKAISTATPKTENKIENTPDYISFPVRNDVQENNLDLEANSISSLGNTEDGLKNNKILLIAGLLFLILLGVGGVYYIQKRGVKEEDGDDFEIES